MSRTYYAQRVSLRWYARLCKKRREFRGVKDHVPAGRYPFVICFLGWNGRLGDVQTCIFLRPVHTSVSRRNAICPTVE